MLLSSSAPDHQEDDGSDCPSDGGEPADDLDEPPPDNQVDVVIHRPFQNDHKMVIPEYSDAHAAFAHLETTHVEAKDHFSDPKKLTVYPVAEPVVFGGITIQELFHVLFGDGSQANLYQYKVKRGDFDIDIQPWDYISTTVAGTKGHWAGTRQQPYPSPVSSCFCCGWSFIWIWW